MLAALLQYMHFCAASEMPTGIYWDYILKTLHTENNLVFHSLFKFEHVWHYVFAYTIDKNKWNTYFVLMGDVSGCEQFGN